MNQPGWIERRVRSAQAGEDCALGDLYLQFCAPLTGLGVRWVQSHRFSGDLAWDISVEVFFRCIRCYKLDHMSKAGFKTYYFRALRLEMCRHHRRKQLPLDEIGVVVDPSPPPSKRVARREMIENLREGLRELDPPIALFLMAHLGHGIPMSHAYRMTPYSYDYTRRMKPIWIERLRQVMESSAVHRVLAARSSRLCAMQAHG